MEYPFFNSKTFSVAMTDKLLDLLNQIYGDVVETNEPGATAKIILEALMRKFESNNNPKLSKASDVTLIENLTKEINILKSDIVNAGYNIEASNKENELLKANIRAQAEKEPTKVIEYKEKDLSATQLLIDFTPLEHAVINFIAEQETVRTKKSITPQIILKDIFNRYVSKGACDFFPIPTNEQLETIRLKFKTA